jgi:dTDP-glucose 4,6-dehydratase
MYGHDVVMITGGCGAIGAVVVNWLKNKYPNTKLVNLDALTYCGKEEHISRNEHDNYVFYKGDITDAEKVSYILQKEQPTLLIHLAAETHVDQSFGNSFRFTNTNVFGTHVLLECVKNYGKLRLFLHMSTDEVYGSVCNAETCTEESMFAPSNPYSASKAAAEMICHAYEKSFKVPIIVMRCNNAISPFQHPEKLIPCCIDTLLMRKKSGDTSRKIPIHGKGESRRVFIHARDIATAIDTIVAKGEKGKVYNIGTGADMERSVIDIAKFIIHHLFGDAVDPEDYLEYVTDRAFQDYRYSIDSTALRDLGWSETVNVEDAIFDVIKYRSQLLSV